MKNWKEVWRLAVAPRLTTGALFALRDALAADDPQLIQGAVTEPAVD